MDTDLDTVKRQVDWQLKELKTDYIDFGMIHCLDEERDWNAYQKNGVLDYLLELKKAGVVRHVGLLQLSYAGIDPDHIGYRSGGAADVFHQSRL